MNENDQNLASCSVTGTVALNEELKGDGWVDGWMDKRMDDNSTTNNSSGATDSTIDEEQSRNIRMDR